MKSAVLAGMVSLLLAVACKDGSQTIGVDAQSDTAPVSTGDGPIDTPRDISNDAAIVDTVAEARRDDAAVSIDGAVDSAVSSDVPIGCPAGTTPAERASPCPAGAVCEYSSRLACDAGCYGGSYVRFECIDNVWIVTLRSAGAPFCYCP